MDKLEEWKKELTEISPWPWSYYAAYTYNKDDGFVCKMDRSNPQGLEDKKFITKAPEKISILIDLVEKAEELARFCKNDHFMHAERLLLDEVQRKTKHRKAREFLDYCKEKLDARD